eukprot:361250-Chlamydomonas_euryale.AAC.23
MTRRWGVSEEGFGASGRREADGKSSGLLGVGLEKSPAESRPGCRALGKKDPCRRSTVVLGVEGRKKAHVGWTEWCLAECDS